MLSGSPPFWGSACEWFCRPDPEGQRASSTAQDVLSQGPQGAGGGGRSTWVTRAALACQAPGTKLLCNTFEKADPFPSPVLMYNSSHPLLFQRLLQSPQPPTEVRDCATTFLHASFSHSSTCTSSCTCAQTPSLPIALYLLFF